MDQNQAGRSQRRPHPHLLQRRPESAPHVLNNMNVFLAMGMHLAVSGVNSNGNGKRAGYLFDFER